MKKLIFLTFSCLLTVSSLAQHCVWDMNLLLALDITTQEEQTKVPNLKISYLGKKGKMIESKSVSTTFWQNPPMSKEYSNNYDREAFIKQEQGFWFLEKDSYVSLVYPSDLKKISAIKVEDIDGMENGHFQTQIIPVKEKDFFSLCVGNSPWVKGDQGKKLEGFQSIQVFLVEK